MGLSTKTYQALVEIDSPKLEQKTIPFFVPKLPQKTVSIMKRNIPSEKLLPYLNKEQLKIVNENKIEINEETNPAQSDENIIYYGDINKFFIINNGLIDIATRKEVEVYIYGLELAKEIPEIFKEFELPKEIPQIPFKDLPRKESIPYFVFKEPKYEHTKDISVLYVNLPYEYYKDIFVSCDAYLYNVDDKKFYIGGVPYMDKIFLFRKNTNKPTITINKESPIIYMRQHKGTIVAMDEAFRLLYAKMFKFPYIAVGIIVDNNMMEFDSFVPEDNPKRIEMFNSICKPYYIA